MKFELLPNEIFLEIFEYLNALDIYHIFDQLNYRFNELSQNLPLYLNCQHAHKSIFDQICSKITFNPELMHRIYSIQLSNNDTCHQIVRFLSMFSLDQFSNLHSLTLIQINEFNVEQLTLVLPFISQLYSFSCIAPETIETKILAILPMSNLRTLSISTLPPLLNHIERSSRITHLTLSKCTLDELYQLFNYTSMLKYLCIKIVRDDSSTLGINTFIHKSNAVHLKQLIIGEFKYQFQDFKIFVNYTPNLKNLSISALYTTDLADANRWKDLITSSLPGLRIFKFIFGYYRSHENEIIAEKFNQFQTDFWHKQHHWYTEYSLDYSMAHIYTIPYSSNTFRLRFHTNRYSHQLTNDSNIFNNVTDLILYYRAVPKNCQYYFSNINTLKLITSEQDCKPVLNIEHLQITKRIINCFYLKHFDISEYGSIATPTILLEIFRNTPHLSSIAIGAQTLVILFNDNKICKYLTKKIKRLEIVGYTEKLFEIKPFCEIFSNIEELKCDIDQKNNILLLLNHLSKLSLLKVYLPALNNQKDVSLWLEEETRKLNLIFHIKDTEMQQTEVNIWIGKHID